MKRDAPPQSDWYPAMDRWMAAPLKDFPREEVGKLLKQCETTFQETEAGARSEDCDWGLTEKLRKTGVSTLLPDVQEMRAIASLLQLRIRLELAEGRTDKAVGTLRTGFALARHVADQPTLICALVGIAVASLMETRLEEVVQQPDAPNLYWALADLPRPFIDLHKPFQGERVMAYGSFPGVAEAAADLNAKPWTPEQVLKGADLRLLLEEERLPLPEAAETAALAFRVLARHEGAKKRLIEQGRPKELVDAMPHLQVAMLDAFLQYDQLFDDSMKWQGLPYWEAQPGMKKAQERHVKILEDKNGPTLPIARLLLPAVLKIVAARVRCDVWLDGEFERSTQVLKIVAARVRCDRRIAALRCVEAVRLYAAAHDGKLPASLDDIKDVPLPPDPVNGKPFDYRVAGDRAYLSCLPIPDQPANNATMPTYELSIKR